MKHDCVIIILNIIFNHLYNKTRKIDILSNIIDKICDQQIILYKIGIVDLIRQLVLLHQLARRSRYHVCRVTTDLI